MLTKAVEIECVKSAREPGIRNPKRPRADFLNIVSHFFKGYNFEKMSFLDLGPGQYDFGEIVRIKGGETTSIELDPAVINLGYLKKMNVIEGNLVDSEVFTNLRDSFDGLFNRGSFNAANFTNETEHRKYLESMISVVKPSGVFWLAPCNDPVADSNSESDKIFQDCVNFQIQFFKDNGFTVVNCTPLMVWAFGIWSTKPELIYTKNLHFSLNEINRKLKIKQVIHNSIPLRIYRKLIRFFK